MSEQALNKAGNEVRSITEGLPNWRPIETAPRDYTAIDVWFVLTDTHAARWANVRWSEEHQTWSNGPPSQYEGGWKPTHWMPLPAPPEAT